MDLQLQKFSILVLVKKRQLSVRQCAVCEIIRDNRTVNHGVPD